MTADLYHGWYHTPDGWHPAPDCHAADEGACAVLLRCLARAILHDDLIVMRQGSTPSGDDSPSLPPAPEPGWVYRRRDGAILMRRKRA